MCIRMCGASWKPSGDHLKYHINVTATKKGAYTCYAVRSALLVKYAHSLDDTFAFRVMKHCSHYGFRSFFPFFAF